MKLGVPSGIGDVSWLISKIINAKEWDEIEFIGADGWPYRLGEYLKLLGKETTYDDFCWHDIMAFETHNKYKTWEDVTKHNVGRFLIQPNSYLEYMPLREYLPDLPTDYHYPLKLPSINKKPYYEPLSKDRWVGISAASYRGAKAWQTWEIKNWASLCKMLLKRGYNIALLGGSWDDLTKELYYSFIKETDRILNLVGKTSFGEVCAVHKLVKYYIGFSSGLGIIRTVMGLPTIMLWPYHQTYLSTSWSDPKDLDSHKYIASGYNKPSEVFSVFKYQESIYK